MVTKIYIELDAVKFMVSKKGALVVVVILIFMLPFIVGDIFINEVENNNEGSDTQEFIELYNSGGVDINLSGWMITDKGGSVDFIPGNTIIFSGGFFVFNESINALSLDKNESINLTDNNGTLIDQTPFLYDDDNDDNKFFSFSS